LTPPNRARKKLKRKIHKTKTLEATLAREISKKEICNVAASRWKTVILQLPVQEKTHFFIPS